MAQGCAGRCDWQWVTLLLMPLVASAIAVPAARAQDREATCADYASSAVEQYRRSLDRSCGFVGLRWQSDASAHYSWCLLVPPEQSDEETEGRQTDLETLCLEADAPVRERCRDYAARAVRQNLENGLRGCGFDELRWGSDENLHYSWCLGAPAEVAAAEVEIRREALESECEDAALEQGEFGEEWPSWDLPDLAVTGFEAPERSEPGESVPLVARVANSGRGTAAESEVAFSVAGREVARSTVGPLSAGSATVVRAEWSGVQPGRYEVAAELDLQGQADADRSNDLRTAIVRLAGDEAPRPELELDLEIEPTSLLPGAVATVRLDARNPSFAELRQVELEVSIDGEPVHSESIDRLGSGESKEVEFTWKVESGQHVIASKAGTPDDVLDAEKGSVRSWLVTIIGTTTVCGSGFQDDWRSLGPRILTNGSVGRMNAIAIDEIDPRVLHAGAATGGLWRSTDRGASWRPFGDRLPNPDIRDIEIDPKNRNRLYAATAYYFNRASDPDAPIYKSVDGGKVWSVFASGLAQGASDLELRYSADGKLQVFAATNSGLFRYTANDPAAITSSSSEWIKIADGIIEDIAVGSDGSLVYASIHKIKAGKRGFDAVYRTFKGTGAPASMGWKPVTPGKPARVVLDIHPGDPKVVFASVLRSGGVDVFRGDQSGGSWTKLLAREDKGIRDRQFNPFVRVNQKGDTIFYGGVRLYKAERAGDGTWKQLRVTGVHDDQKMLEFEPGSRSSRYYILNDGGIWHCKIKPGKSDDCKNRNYDLRTTQIFDFDAGSKNAALLAGTQDNGTIYSEGKPDWKEVRGGDGYFSLIAPSDNRVRYSQEQKLADTKRSFDGGAWKPRDNAAAVGLPQSGSEFGSGFITVHPLDADSVYAQGKEVLHTIDGGSNWSPIGPKGSNVRGNANRMAVQPNTGRIFAGTDSQGQVWERRAVTWSPVSFHPDAKATVIGITFAPTDPNVLYLAYDNADPYRRLERLEWTATGGWNGSYITDNLPGASAVNGRPFKIRALSGDGSSATTAYVGTDQGVFRGRAPCGNCAWDWQPYNKCLPWVPVNDLLVDPESGELRAATWGRGVWGVKTKP